MWGGGEVVAVPEADGCVTRVVPAEELAAALFCRKSAKKCRSRTSMAPLPTQAERSIS